MSTEKLRLEEHPDIAEVKGHYEWIGERPALQMAAGLTLITGLFVALSPWIVGFAADQPSLAINNLVVGLAAACLALGYASTFRSTHGVSWVVPILGIWTIISPWVVAGTMEGMRSILTNVIAGAVMTLLGLAVLGNVARRGKE